MRRLQAMTGVAAIVLVSACAPALAHTSAGRGGATGTVSGKLQIEGGPISTDGKLPGKRPTPGTVQFTSRRHHRVTVRVGDSGTFSVHLPAGTYAACSLSSGSSGPCSKARQVTVTARHTTEIAFTFLVP
jgi:hypothetical protein